MRTVLLLAAIGLAACTSTPPPPATEREVQNALRIARADFSRHRFAQAADGYGRAVEVAWRLDDPAVVATAGSERALALLRAGEAAAARAEAAALDDELARRGLATPPLLVLVRAAAALRLDRLDAAAAQLDRGELRDVAPTVAGRRDYLRGRIAAARGDAVGLRRAIAALPAVGPATLVADRRELEARLAALEGRHRDALDLLLALEAERRRLDEPTAVGETLELAAEAATALGEPARAADLHLRAARNALSIDRTELADARLERAAGAAARVEAPDLDAAIAALRERVAAAS